MVGGIDSLESIPGPLKSLKIPFQVANLALLFVEARSSETEK
jgi:hypothetical protein